MAKTQQLIDSVVVNGSTRSITKLGVILWRDENGHLHREDGPAVKYPGGGECWYKRGKYHRLNGPATIQIFERDDYYADGRRFTEDEFYRYVDQDTGEVLVPPGKKLTHDR